MRKRIGLVLLVRLASLSALGAEPAPYGSKDFYPSADRPIGFRGDGKILGTQPPYSAGNFKTAVGHGVSRVALDDLYLSSESGDIPSSPAAVMKVTLVSRDEAKIEQVAVLDSGSEDRGPLRNDPVVLTPKGVVWYAGNAWDLRTGKRAGEVVSKRRCRPPSAVQVGNYIVFNPLSAAGGRAEDDVRLCLCPFGVADISDPANQKIATVSNLLGGEEMPADIFVDQYLGLSREEKLRLMGSSYPGIANWFGVRNNGVFASGNRIFLQSTMAAYCIGDPSVKFDWNPASRPEQVTKQLSQPK